MPESCDECKPCMFFQDTDLLGCIIINVKSKSVGFFFSLSLFFFFFALALLLPPCLLLSATSCGLEPFQMACLSCSVVLFRRFHLPPHRSYRLTAKLRYENKQLAVELTAEKKSTANAPSQTLLFFCLLLLTLSPNNIQEKADGDLKSLTPYQHNSTCLD